MTPEEKVGQMLVCGWSDVKYGDCKRLNPHAAALIDDLHVGGIIFMGRNISPPQQLRALTQDLQARALAAGLPPLFVATDQEGGRVSALRRRHYATRPSAQALGRAGDDGETRQASASLGAELASVGINWDFAPVLDVNNNPRNPVIGTRSFGADASLVARLGVAALQGLQNDAGIMACGKHFPGHGDTDTNSHFALPRIPHPRARLDLVELAPFRAAIAQGIAAIMTAHILFPALDTDLPATLSPAILTGLLRDELGYEGLIITDDLEMKGVAARWGVPEAAVLAVEAGADLLLCCHTRTTQYAIRDALLAALCIGTTDRSAPGHQPRPHRPRQGAVARGRVMPAKVCPRCGEQYEHLHSTTCPSCFAKLVTVDDATAAAFAEARSEVVQTPEFQAAKSVDDERFRHQSFGACLGVLAIFLITAIAAIALLVHAAHDKTRGSHTLRSGSRAIAPTRALTTLPALPVAAATLEDVLPPSVGSFARLSADQGVNIPGTLTPIFHARYGPATAPVDAYAVPADRPTSEINAFQLGLTLASQAGPDAQARAPLFFATEHWRLAVLGGSPSLSNSFHDQYISQFAARSR